jgi:uncharacterized protein
MSIMLNQQNILDFLRDHLADLKLEYQISKIGLFGSFARNEQNEHSDIDIMLEFEPGTHDIYNKKAKLRAYLQSCLQHDVDLCREKYIKPYIKAYLDQEVIYV